jgi:hypothetical protein
MGKTNSQKKEGSMQQNDDDEQDEPPKIKEQATLLSDKSDGLISSSTTFRDCDNVAPTNSSYPAQQQLQQQDERKVIEVHET